MRLPTIHGGDSVELADLRTLRRPMLRTSVSRLALAGALAATLAGIVLLARSAGAGRAAVLPSGATTGCVVLDMSASISGPVYERVATVLRGIVAANQSICLVMFSDTAYELLPPNSPPGALLDFVPFFVPVRFYGGSPVFVQSPWDQFSGGTNISAGFVVGAEALKRAHVRHGALLLISDLDDSSADIPNLNAEAVRLRQEKIPVRIVPLFATSLNKGYFAALFGAGSFVSPTAFRHRAHQTVQPVAADVPWALIGLGIVLVVLLAGNERWNARLVAEPA
ncbi:MAG TPA: vWA domain-containing protein [Gaiellaceae bacterium]|nr:vWA domain-containing protein [Gaiellaceae bacterium]